MDRREFLRNSAMLAAGVAATSTLSACGVNPGGNTAGRRGNAAEGSYGLRKEKIKLEWEPFTAEMRYTFTISGSSRSSTPIVLTQVHWNGYTGYGEASMPPYLGESHASVDAFLRRVHSEVLPRFDDAFLLDAILHEVDALAPGNCAAKAAVDIALHDLLGKIMGRPWWRIWGFDAADCPHTCYTIGFDESDDIVRTKTREASWNKYLKLKLGQSLEQDKRMVRLVREVCPDTPIYVDANQGWHDRIYAAEMCAWLAEQGVVMVEQPMPKDDLEGNGYVSAHSPVPVVADESCQRLADIPKLAGAFNAINIKLMKCSGMREAREMVTLAHALGMSTMIGCMTETSVAISAAAQLSPKMRWADLDGNLLIANDCFSGMKLDDGRITLSELPGIGVKPL